MSQVVYVAPSFYDTTSSDAPSSSSRGLSFALSPLNNQAAVFVQPSDNVRNSPQDSLVEPNIALICVNDTPATAEDRRLFCVDTSTITATFHQLLTEGHESGLAYPLQLQEYREVARKLAVDFMNFSKELWIHSSKLLERGAKSTVDPEHYRIIKTCFHLFIVMELPDVEEEGAVVADEIMEWLNINFIEPSTEEGDYLSGLARAWEDDNFWPYLVRTAMRGMTKASVFFLQNLGGHPSEHARRAAAMLVPILSNHPRLQYFDSKKDYSRAWHRWKEDVRSVRVTLDRVPNLARRFSKDDWWNHLSDLVGILEGNDEVVVRVCQTIGADWKELCAVWSVFVEPGLQRGSLREIVEEHCDDILPHDPTSAEDKIHYYLFTRQHAKALEEAAKFDIWLAAHLALFMEPLELFQLQESQVDDEEDVFSLREQYMLAYAEYLHSDATLWRIVTQYMYTCGPIGTARADEVLLRVPARLSKRDAQKERETGLVEQVAEGDYKSAFDALNRTCLAYKREFVRRAICQIAARTYLGEKNYSEAFSHYISAEDSIGVGHVVDQVLEEYILHGPEAFTRFVVEELDQFLNDFVFGRPMLADVAYARLLFIVCFARFHRYRLDGDFKAAATELAGAFRHEIVPKSWWAVLLDDSLELLNYSGPLVFEAHQATMFLHRLEEIHIRTSQGLGDEYLGVLAQKTKAAGPQEALLSLGRVRQALARYHARCAVIGISSKDSIGRAPTSVSVGWSF